jgi:NADPH:quinone reductase
MQEVLPMRAMVFDRYGEPDVMRLTDLPVPEPQDGEVLIRVAYAGVNPADSKARAGHSRGGYRDFALPCVVGMDAAGVVEQRGTNVTEFRRGDRVITWGPTDGKAGGTYAEFVRVSARNISPMPGSLSFAQAAAGPIASLTAFQSLFHTEKGGMIPGQRVLINGAAGGVGSFAVRFAKAGGLLVGATCGTANVAYVRSLGADRVIDYKTEDVCRAVCDWSAEGVDVVLDAVGPASLPQALDMLRPGGRLISILTVTVDGDIERDQKAAQWRGFRKIMSIIDFERARESLREITHLIDNGLIHVPPIGVLPLEEAARSHQMIDSGHVRGKLVLKVSELSA